MPLMLSALYDALLDAGAHEEQARRAAEEGADYESVDYDPRFVALERTMTRLLWLVACNLMLTLGTLWWLLSR